jgi:hypothetical protein
MNHCTKCNKPILPAWKTCNECGNKITKTPWAPHNYIPESEGSRRGLSRKEYDMLLALVGNGVSQRLIAHTMQRTKKGIEYHLAPTRPAQ